MIKLNTVAYLVGEDSVVCYLLRRYILDSLLVEYDVVLGLVIISTTVSCLCILLL